MNLKTKIKEKFLLVLSTLLQNGYECQMNFA